MRTQPTNIRKHCSSRPEWAGDSHIDECLIKSGEACLVQGYMHAIAGVKALNVRLVAVPSRVERRSPNASDR
jgi:hypothetical protein